MKNKLPLLSICIVNYNATEYLAGCLKSIYTKPPRTGFEVVLVDNGSRDSSYEQVLKNYPKVRLIKIKKNVGFIRGNNRALKASKGKYLLSLNNDTIVLPGSLDRLVAYGEKHPEVGAFGPKVLNADGTIQHQCKRGTPTPWNTLAYMLQLHKLFPGNPKFSGYLLLDVDTDKVQDVASLSGCAMIVRRDVAQKIGYMDPGYIMYGDDIDWSFRVREAGWAVRYVPTAKIIHFGGAGGSGKAPYKSLYWFYRAAHRFYRIHLASDHLFLLNWLVYAGIWAKFISTATANVFRREKVIGSKKPQALKGGNADVRA